MSLRVMIKEIWPSPSTWIVNRDMPDLSGKVAIVTGGNTGIGRETVKQLLKKNAKVYMAARSKPKAEEALAAIETETGKRGIFLELDLASLASVTKAVADFRSKEPSLHMLFNSGGVMAPPIEQTTTDSYDLQFGTNVPGHAALTLGLIDELIAGAKSSPDGKARVINVSSNAAYFTVPEGVRFDVLTDGPERRQLGTIKQYGHSKYGNWVFSCELARRYAKDGIVSNALHPGGIHTELQRHAPRIFQVLTHPFHYPVEFGALTPLYLGTAPEMANVSGKWFVPWARQTEFPGPQNEATVGPRLWDWIEEQRKAFLRGSLP